MIVCGQCGHVDPHTSGPVTPIPYQPVGSTVRTTLNVQECGHTTCFCNLYVPRALLPSEPAL